MKEDSYVRLKQAREEAGFKTAEAGARAVGMNVTTYRSMENGTRGFGEERAIECGKRFGVNPAWLMFGSEYVRKSLDPTGDREPPRNSGVVASAPCSTAINELDVGFHSKARDLLDALQHIDEVEYFVDQPMVIGRWQVPDYFTRGSMRIDPNRALIIEMFGDSGFDPQRPNARESFFPGDRVVVDTNDKKPSPPGAFAVFDGIGITVRFVESVNRGGLLRLRISSVNPKYATYEVALNEAHIIGRVRGRISLC